MAKYRKRPVVIEAVQLRWDNWTEMCVFLGAEFFANGGKGVRTEPLTGAKDTDTVGLDIPTLEGTMHATGGSGAFADVGDWIIRGVMGELYPCKNDIFKVTYELVEE